MHGPYEPEAGHRFNPAKLLLDPYAKAIAGSIRWSDALFGYTIGHPDADLSRDTRTAPRTCRSASSSTRPSVGGTTRASAPWHKTLIYELHVKGFTARHPEVPPALRGTYAGLTCPAVIDYLCTLGITAVELMPVQQFVADKHLVDQGLTNYWGYNSIGFFPRRLLCQHRHPGAAGGRVQDHGQDPAPRGHRGDPRRGLQSHRRGNHLGPTLCFRGIDNAAYYRRWPTTAATIWTTPAVAIP